jgi:predicted pyridoxine 5'-phosphate oxidase superfamily flavin-nucleotide-binding protein
MSKVIATVAALEERIGKASELVRLKAIDHLDAGALGWIEAAPLMFAGFGDGGRLAITLGGGDPGWAEGDAHELRFPASKLDDPALARPGSSFGSIFMIPSISEILRVNGRVAKIDRGEIRIAIDECYFHCGKALIRSGFWETQDDAIAPEDTAAFATASRFLALATIDTEGNADLSPRGDPAGAMTCFEDGTLWFADRPGNKRIDSFRNIVAQPHVAAVIVIPGAAQVMCITGTARITEDEALRARFAVNGKVPALVTGIGHLAVERRESSALTRARVWPAPAAPAHINPAKIAIAHMKLIKSASARSAGAALSEPGALQRELDKEYKNNLY